jgi:phage gp36-like protein
MGVYLSTTSISLLLPGYFISNTGTSDTEGLLIAGHHIDRAESIINASLSRMYNVPFSPIPPIIRTITEDITVYNLLKATSYRQGQMNEYYDANYKASSDILSKLASGSMPLPLTNGSLVSMKASNRIKVSTEGYEPIMNIDEPTNWTPNDTEADDVSDTRT